MVLDGTHDKSVVAQRSGVEVELNCYLLVGRVEEPHAGLEGPHLRFNKLQTCADWWQQLVGASRHLSHHL
jgi:hypothetical protein